MSISLAKVFSPSHHATPSATQVVESLLSTFKPMLQAAWRAIEHMGQARADGELERLAQHYGYNPELANMLRGAKNGTGCNSVLQA